MLRLNEQIRGRHTGTQPGVADDPHYESWIDTYGPLDHEDDPTTRLARTYARRINNSPIVTVGHDVVTVCRQLASSANLPAEAPIISINGSDDFILRFDGGAGESPWKVTTPGYEHPDDLYALVVADNRCLGLTRTPAVSTLQKELQPAAEGLPPLMFEGDGLARMTHMTAEKARQLTSEAADTIDESFTPDGARVVTAVLYAIKAGLVEVTRCRVLTANGMADCFDLTPPQSR